MDPSLNVGVSPPAAESAGHGQSFWQGFREGAAAPWRGLQYLRQHPRLIRYAVLPVIFNLLITVLAFTVLIVSAVALATYVHPQFDSTWSSRALEVLSFVAILVVVLLLTIGTWILLQGILCGYFYNLLACQIELAHGMSPDVIRDVTLWYQLVDTLRNLLALVIVSCGFLLLNVVPVVGSLLALAGTLYYDWYIFGLDYFDYPLALRGMRREDKRNFARDHRAQTLGLGSAVFVLSFIPIVGSVLLTTAVAGAVLLHRKLAIDGPLDGKPPHVAAG